MVELFELFLEDKKYNSTMQMLVFLNVYVEGELMISGSKLFYSLILDMMKDLLKGILLVLGSSGDILRDVVIFK